MSSEDLDLDLDERVRTEFQAGQVAFERGQYRQSIAYLEAARNAVDRNSKLGGEVQMWLVTAYEAAGQHTEAMSLGRQLKRHPRLQIRQQARRLVYILEAPKLSTRSDWLVQLPDLSNLDDNAFSMSQISASAANKQSANQRPESEPIDWSQVNTKDNQFIWMALIGAVIVIAGLAFFV